jgi:sugar phosphate isomerase/epimerase
MPVLTMNRLKLAVCVESLGLPLRRGLAHVERMGVRGVQVDAAGDLAPNSLSQTGRRELLHVLRSHNLELAALGCPLRHGLDRAEGQEARIEHVKKVLSLSFDLGARLATLQAGQVPEALDAPQARFLNEALLALGQHGDRTGTVLALETGPESGQALSRFLSSFDTGGLGVALDPANLVLSGFDPYESARALQGRVVYALARDARRGGGNRTAQEVPLGHGDIEWMSFLSVLEEIEYHGWLAVKRDTGDNRLGDIAAGVQFLRRFVGSSQ